MPDSCLCQFRTGVLLLGFMLGSFEVTLAVIFYTFKAQFQAFVGYKAPPFELDLIAVLVIVGVDLIVNILMISGANKDYSGRRKDLRRWGFMIPWLIVYGLNIIGYFAASIVIFYLGVGSTKACGVVPLIYACTLVVGHFSVVYFVLEQRSDFLSGACNNIVDSEASSPA